MKISQRRAAAFVGMVAFSSLFLMAAAAQAQFARALTSVGLTNRPMAQDSQQSGAQPLPVNAHSEDFGSEANSGSASGKVIARTKDDATVEVQMGVEAAGLAKWGQFSKNFATTAEAFVSITDNLSFTRSSPDVKAVEALLPLHGKLLFDPLLPIQQQQPG